MSVRSTLALCAVALCAPWLSGSCGGDEGGAPAAGASGVTSDGEPDAPGAHGAARGGRMIDKGDGLEVVILIEGRGAAARAGRTVRFHQRLLLAEGEEEIDSSSTRGVPLCVALGEGRLMPGLERGIEGLREGTRARMRIPAALAWGEADFAEVPAGSDLVAEIELVGVE